MGLGEALIRSMPRTLLGALSGFAFGLVAGLFAGIFLWSILERLFVFSAAETGAAIFLLTTLLSTAYGALRGYSDWRARYLARNN